MGAAPTEAAKAFGDGFWSLIPFTMQMAFVVIGGYVVASSPPSQQLIALPGVPSQLQSHLLQRRPDIAAAERRVFAANANIGVAKAAWYPDFSLTGLIGGQTQGVGNLLSASNRYWALGPLVNLPIFDGGRLSANERQAKAEFEEASAHYRSQVLKAVREVEDNLAQLRDLQQEAQDEQAAADAAQHTQALAMNSYQAGAVSRSGRRRSTRW